MKSLDGKEVIGKSAVKGDYTKIDKLSDLQAPTLHQLNRVFNSPSFENFIVRNQMYNDRLMNLLYSLSFVMCTRKPLGRSIVLCKRACESELRLDLY